MNKLYEINAITRKIEKQITRQRESIARNNALNKFAVLSKKIQRFVDQSVKMSELMGEPSSPQMLSDTILGTLITNNLKKLALPSWSEIRDEVILVRMQNPKETIPDTIRIVKMTFGYGTEGGNY